MRYAPIVLLSVLAIAAAKTPWSGDDSFTFDIAPRAEFPQSLAEGSHPHAWAEDLTVPQSSAPFTAVELTITPWAEFEYAYDAINTSNIPGGDHWVNWERLTNRVRLRDSSDGMLLAEHRQWMQPFREQGVEGDGDIDFGDMPVHGSQVLTEGDDVLVVTLDDPETLRRFQGEGDVTLRVVAWSDYEIVSPAMSFFYGGVVRCGARITVRYL